MGAVDPKLFARPKTAGKCPESCQPIVAAGITVVLEVIQASRKSEQPEITDPRNLARLSLDAA